MNFKMKIYSLYHKYLIKRKFKTMITAKQLAIIAIFAKESLIMTYTPLLNKYMTKYEINTLYRKSAFLATIIHESGSFKYTREIASGVAYEGRKDLGNIHKGDGVKFRGRGLIQLTGRSNYERASKAFGVDFIAQPELIEQPEWATAVSAWWWHQRGLNAIADTKDFRRVTRMVNGGYNGMADRQKWYDRALNELA